MSVLMKAVTISPKLETDNVDELFPEPIKFATLDLQNTNPIDMMSLVARETETQPEPPSITPDSSTPPQMHLHPHAHRPTLYVCVN